MSMGIINHFCNSMAWLHGLFASKKSFVGRNPALIKLRLHEILDENAVENHLVSEEKLLLATLKADADFKYDLYALFVPETDRIIISCITKEFKIPDKKLTDALLFCNKWNQEKLFPSVFLDPVHNTFTTHYCALLDKENSMYFFREQVVDRGLGISRLFFIKAGEIFIEK